MLLGYKVTWVELTERLRPASVAAAAPAEEDREQDRIRSHPKWARLEQAVLRALLPFVEAREAVCRELAALEPENST